MNIGTLDIATAPSVLSKNWINEKISWSNLSQKLSNAIETNYTYDEYNSMSKDDQGKIKDVGGYVGGFLSSKERTKTSVQYRQLLCLDIDHATLDFWDTFTMMYDVAAVLHTTHSHTEDSPRFRLIIPLDRKVSRNEYEAIGRQIAGELDIELFDSTTFQASRLMFWPAIPKGGKYYFKAAQGAWLDVDKVLGSYIDWKDTIEWPRHAKDAAKVLSLKDKQLDPREKPGLIGAFCRTYTIQEAIEKFIPDVYEESSEGRYSFTGGSTSNGVIVYDDLFIFSHHDTDPCGSRLSNVYDMVRLNKFGYLDSNSRAADTNKSPSIKAMQELMLKDSKTMDEQARTANALAKEDFLESLPEERKETDENYDWFDELEVDPRTNKILSTSRNIEIILLNDPILKNLFWLDEFEQIIMTTGVCPWDDRKREVDRPYNDIDASGLRVYFENTYDIVNISKIEDAFKMSYMRNATNSLTDYLDTCIWDKVPRLDSFAHEYFGVEQTPYHAAAIAKTLISAVARAYKPGIKCDQVLVLIGKQGCGKSSFVQAMGQKWSTDSITQVGTKDSMDLLRISWIVEIAELTAFRKQETEAIKQFLTSQVDVYRRAYGKQTERNPRKCVFIGTTNDETFLTDATGNRRFIPLSIRQEFATKNIFDLAYSDSEESQEIIDQMLAEAKFRFEAGEPLHFNAELTKVAEKVQSLHIEVDHRLEGFRKWLNTPITEDWYDLSIDAQRMHIDGVDPVGVERLEFCAAEVLALFSGNSLRDTDKRANRENVKMIRALIDTGEWLNAKSSKGNRMRISTKAYGRVNYYTRNPEFVNNYSDEEESMF